jgi:flagellar hook-associated protein 3 FlgL
MRVSTSQFFNSSVNAMLDDQSNLSKTQQQLSTGRKILTPADDPTGSQLVLSLNQTIETTTQYQRNADVARGRQQLEDTTLGSATDLLQRVRELVVQANNDSQTPETRGYMAQELRQLRAELIQFANTRDASGEFLYSGFSGKVQPFAETSGGQVQYLGDQGTRYLQIGPSQQVADSDPGSAVFLGIRNGNGTFTTRDTPAPPNQGTGIIDPGSVTNAAAYVADTYTIAFVTNGAGQLAYNVFGAASGQLVPALPADSVIDAPAYVDGGAIQFNGIEVAINGLPVVGDSFTVSPSVNQDVFTTVQNLITGLEGYVPDTAGLARLHNALNRGLEDLDRAMNNLTDIRARVGARLNSIDAQKGANDSFALDAQQALSAVQDLDYGEAVSRLNRQLLSLQAAQQTFARVQGLSLFDFLR